MNKIPCPRCGQDYVVGATIKPLNEQILICPECEAFWWANEAVSMQSFKNFGVYVESKGYPWDWGLLAVTPDPQVP